MALTVQIESNGGVETRDSTVSMDHGKRRGLLLVLEDQGQDEENADYEYSLFNYKPRFCDMKTPLSSSVTKMDGRSERVTGMRSRSSSMLLPTQAQASSSSIVAELGQTGLDIQIF